MIACALPDGVDDEHYWPLMKLLGEGMSLRQLSSFMGLLFRRGNGDPMYLYNDALGAMSEYQREPPTNFEELRQRLLACGYERFLAVEDFGDDED
jgi:hypothetical protein